jgi:hypothetical protein
MSNVDLSILLNVVAVVDG